MKTIIPRVSLSLLLCGASMLTAIGASSSTGTSSNPFSTSDQWQWDPDRNGIDIYSAWQSYGKGAGVTIGILDEWLDYSVEDLTPNYSESLSKDYVDSITLEDGEIFDPSTAYEDEEHGTMVAGMAAAAGVSSSQLYGAAPSATLVGLHTDLSNDTISSAFLYGSGLTSTDSGYVYSTAPVVKIMNCSWGDTSDLYTSDQSGSPFETLVTAASQNNMIIVFAAGNSRGYSVGSHDYNTGLTGQIAGTSESYLTEAIFVGATNTAGTYAEFSSYGSMLFCVAPGDDVYTTRRSTSTSTGDITEITDDEDDTSTSTRATVLNQPTSGTSFSAPIVSGVLALGAAANPVMDYRWAKHALARSCDVLDTMAADETTTWTTNSAGYTFSNDYGFGLVNANSFVGVVKNIAYETIAESHTETLAAKSFTTNSTSATATQRVSIKSTSKDYAASKIEDIQVTVNMSVVNVIGKLGYEGMTITLTHTTADGYSTTSTLLSPTVNEDTVATTYDTFNWTFTTNAFWGETVEGDWTLSFTCYDTETNLANLKLNSGSITFNVGEVVMEGSAQAKMNAATNNGEALNVRSFVWDSASSFSIASNDNLAVQDTIIMNAGTIAITGDGKITAATSTESVIDLGGVAIYLNGGSLSINGDGASVTAARGLTMNSSDSTLTLQQGTLAAQVTLNAGSINILGREDGTVSVSGITMNGGSLSISTTATDLTNSHLILGEVKMNAGTTNVSKADVTATFVVNGGVLNIGAGTTRITSVTVGANPAVWNTYARIVIKAQREKDDGTFVDVKDPTTGTAKIYVDEVVQLTGTDKKAALQAAIDGYIATLTEDDTKGYTYVAVEESTVTYNQKDGSAGTAGKVVVNKGAVFNASLSLTGGVATTNFGNNEIPVDASGNLQDDIYYYPELDVYGGKINGAINLNMANLVATDGSEFTSAIDLWNMSTAVFSGTQVLSGGIEVNDKSSKLYLNAGTSMSMGTSSLRITDGDLYTYGAVTLKSSKNISNYEIVSDPTVASVLEFDAGTYHYTVGNTITIETEYSPNLVEYTRDEDTGVITVQKATLPTATVEQKDGSTIAVPGQAVVLDGATIAMDISFASGVLPQSTMPFLKVLSSEVSLDPNDPDNKTRVELSEAIAVTTDSNGDSTLKIVIDGTPPQIYVGDLPDATSEYEDLCYTLDLESGSFVSGNDVEIDATRLRYSQFTSEQKGIQYAIAKCIGMGVSEDLIKEINKFTLVTEVTAAYDQLLPVNLKTIATLHNKQANAVVGTIERRSRELRCGAPVADIWANPLFSSSGFSYTIDPHLLAATSFRQFDLTNYTTPFLAWMNGGHTFSDGKDVKHTGKTETKLSNASIGFDYGVTDTLSLGVFIGYLDGETKLKTNDSSTEVQVRNIGVYAAGSTTDDIGSTYYTAMLSYGMAEYDFKRNTRIGNYSSTATADPDGTQVIAFVSAGYEWDAGSHALTYQWTTGPSISLRYTYNSVDGYSESGNGIDALKTDDFDYSSLLLQIAWRTTARFDIPAFCTIVPELRLTYSHEFIDSDADIDTSFVALPTAKYSTAMNHEGQDYFTIGIGNTFMITEGFTVTVDYDCTLGREDSEPEHSFNVMARCRF